MSENTSLDLRYIKCPLNFVKAKLALEKHPPGQPLRIMLSGDLSMNVPQSLRQEGYTVTEWPSDGGGIMIDVVKQS